MIDCVAGDCGAERCADSHCAADNAKPQIEAAGTTGDVGDHERKRHAEHGG